MKGRLLIALCVLSAAALAISNASAQVVRVGNLIIEIEGGVSPKKLPRDTLAPITLDLSGSIATADKTQVPVLRTLSLEFDKHGTLNTKGLAICNTHKLQSTVTSQAKQSCKDSLIGQGRAEAEIYLPEQPPFSAGGQLLIFNGPPKGNNPTLIAHVYAFVPAPTTFVTTIDISKAKGKYATKAEVKIPTIVSGQGSLISFKAKLHKTWSYKGQRQNLLLARCANGHFFAHGDFLFSDGTKLSGDVAKSCGNTKG
jgi:hypothetical protein